MVVRSSVCRPGPVAGMRQVRECCSAIAMLGIKVAFLVIRVAEAEHAPTSTRLGRRLEVHSRARTHR